MLRILMESAFFFKLGFLAMLIFMGPDDLHLKSLMVAHIERHTHEKNCFFSVSKHTNGKQGIRITFSQYK